MEQRIAHIALLVSDYDEAKNFYVDKLNFRVIEDTALDANKRWLLISPPGNGSCHLLLAKASNEAQMSSIGNQAGGRVFLFLYTDDLMRDYHNMVASKIIFVREPVVEKWGRVAVFQDLYGNLWDLIEPVKQ